MIKHQFLKKEQIENEANKLIASYKSYNHIDKEKSNNIYIINTTVLLDLCKDNHFINDYDFRDKSEIDNDILGQFIFNNKTIIIYSDDTNNINRENFTIAHEIGHSILHYKLWKNTGQKISYTCNRNMIDGSYNDDNNIRILEWQANYFAGCVLMPKEVVFQNYLIFKNLVDNLPVEYSENLNDLYKYVAKRDSIGFISFSMKVSRQAATIRLEELQLLLPNYLAEKDKELFMQTHSFVSRKDKLW